MQGDIPMIRSRIVMPIVVVSAAILVTGCVTSVKVRKPSANCPACQQGRYATPQSVPVAPSQLYPVPDSAPFKGNDVTLPPAPYPAPPPEARRLFPNFRARTISSVQGPDRKTMNSFE
jgi:hypothetical protein